MTATWGRTEMKCPMRQDMIGKMPECDPECAWLVQVSECCAESQVICAMVLMGSPMDCPRKPLNTMEVEDE